MGNGEAIIEKLISCQTVRQRAEEICRNLLMFYSAMTPTQLDRIVRYCQRVDDPFNQTIDGIIIQITFRRFGVELSRLTSKSQLLTPQQYAARVNEMKVDAERIVRKYTHGIKRYTLGKR